MLWSIDLGKTRTTECESFCSSMASITIRSTWSHWRYVLWSLLPKSHSTTNYLIQQGGSPRTMFPIEDEGVYQQAEQLAREAKSSRQFTDVNKFTLKCIQCDVHLTGQVEAQSHAKQTGHTNFGEVWNWSVLISVLCCFATNCFRNASNWRLAWYLLKFYISLFFRQFFNQLKCSV